MGNQYLLNPEFGICSQCGIEGHNRRKFISSNKTTCFCDECWKDFIDECNIQEGFWEQKILEKWPLDIQIHLVVKVNYGTTQKIKWN